MGFATVIVFFIEIGWKIERENGRQTNKNLEREGHTHRAQIRRALNRYRCFFSLHILKTERTIIGIGKDQI